MEKNCRWHFDTSGQALTGPNDSIHETFKANPYYSIVRESIQNSLDAVLNEDEPVRVSYSFDKIEKDNYPNLFDIKKHIIACWQTHKDDNQAEKLFHPMTSYIDRNSNIEILKISDYNTKGMNYEKSDLNSGFISFVRAEGKSSKSDVGAGGSFGFGKGAYYVLSKLKTILVSTKTDEGNNYFEGKTRLATHYLNGEKYSRDGFYNKDYTEPVSSIDEIPELFQRKKIGTDIFIVGLIRLDNRKTEMIKSVLNNFWLAIHDGKLVVKVDDTEINKENLERSIDEHFTNIIESGSANDIESWNPKPYFKAVKYANATEQYKVFPDTLPALGSVKFYIYLEKKLPNRTAFFRQPRMVVYKKTSRKVQGYAGVFVCEDKKGNQILKEMENPAHNEWKKGNYLNEENEIHQDAKIAEKQISEFINSKLDELSKSKTGKKLVFEGLEEYLSIPEDLLEQDDEYDLDGNVSNTNIGNLSDELTDQETGMETTAINEGVEIRPTIKRKSEIKEDDNVEPDELGVIDITTGHGEGSGDNPTPPVPGPDDDFNKGNFTDEDLESRVLKKIKFKVVAQKENGHYYHNLIINTGDEISNAELLVFVGADNDRDDGIAILETSSGDINKNSLRNVQLNSGKNIVKIRFEDNLKHTVKLKAYELQ